jgi:hypothetical protein
VLVVAFIRSLGLDLAAKQFDKSVAKRRSPDNLGVLCGVLKELEDGRRPPVKRL